MKSEIVKKRLGKIYVFIIVGIFLLIASALAIVSGDDDDWYDQNNLGIPPTSINDHIYTYGSVAITEIDEENPLGIGASKLVIYDDNGGIANVRFVDEDTGTGMGDGIIVGIDENHDGIIWNYEDADIGFGIGDQEIMTIENELEVGIGTTNPSARLEVNPTVTSNQNYYGITVIQ